MNGINLIQVELQAVDAGEHFTKPALWIKMPQWTKVGKRLTATNRGWYLERVMPVSTGSWGYGNVAYWTYVEGEFNALFTDKVNEVLFDFAEEHWAAIYEGPNAFGAVINRVSALLVFDVHYGTPKIGFQFKGIAKPEWVDWSKHML